MAPFVRDDVRAGRGAPAVADPELAVHLFGHHDGIGRLGIGDAGAGRVPVPARRAPGRRRSPAVGARRPPAATTPARRRPLGTESAQDSVPIAPSRARRVGTGPCAAGSPPSTVTPHGQSGADRRPRRPRSSPSPKGDPRDDHASTPPIPRALLPVPTLGAPRPGPRIQPAWWSTAWPPASAPPARRALPGPPRRRPGRAGRDRRASCYPPITAASSCLDRARRPARTTLAPTSTTTTVGARPPTVAGPCAPLPAEHRYLWGRRLRSTCLAILSRHGRSAPARAALAPPPLRLRGRQPDPGQGPGRRHGLRGPPSGRARRVDTRRLRAATGASGRAAAASATPTAVGPQPRRSTRPP